MTLLLSKDDKVFLNFDNGGTDAAHGDTLLKFRPKILTEMGKRYNITFTDGELREFEKYPSSIGLPINKMKDFLNTKDVKTRMAMETGIPIDSTDNQLADWIYCTRTVNPAVSACIKGDAKTGFEVVNKVLKIMADKNVFKFSLITSLEAVPTNLTEKKK
jgi:hypothetical protein